MARSSAPAQNTFATPDAVRRFEEWRALHRGQGTVPNAVRRFEEWRASKRGQPATPKTPAVARNEFAEYVREARAFYAAKVANPKAINAVRRFDEWRARKAHAQASDRVANLAARTARVAALRRSSRASIRPAPLAGMYVGQNAINAITRAVGRQRRLRRR